MPGTNIAFFRVPEQLPKKYEKGDKVVVNYHNEMIATEIVRALVGSIGLVLVVPIATFLGIEFGK